jgi:hypothetical protein
MPQKNHKNSQFAIDFLLSCHWFQCLQFFFSPQIFSRCIYFSLSYWALTMCLHYIIFPCHALRLTTIIIKIIFEGTRKQEVSRESGDGTDGKVNSMKSENVMGILWWSMKEVSSFAQHSLSASLDDTRDIFFSLSFICLFSCFRF